MQVRSFGTRGGPSALNEHGLEPGSSPAKASRPALARTFVVARTQASPGAQVCSGGEPAHVGADREYQEFRARGRFSSLADEPFAEHDGELGLGLEPFARRPFPFVSRF